MTKEQEEKLKFVIDSLANDSDIIKLVRDIEAGPMTTKNHYGDYGAAISALANGSRTTAYVISQAMKKAGGSVEGIDWAVRLFI